MSNPAIFRGKIPLAFTLGSPIVLALSTPSQTSESFLEIGDKGFGFLRSAAKNYAPSSQDTFVSGDLIRQHGLRAGGGVGAHGEPPIERMFEWRECTYSVQPGCATSAVTTRA